MATKKWWDGWYDPEEAEQMQQKNAAAAQPQQTYGNPDAARKAAYEKTTGRSISDDDWAKIQSANRRMTITSGDGTTGADGYGKTTASKTIGVDFDKSPQAGTEAISKYYSNTGAVPESDGVKTGIRYSGFEDENYGPTKVRTPGDLSGTPPWAGAPAKGTYTAPNGTVYDLDAEAMPGPLAKGALSAEKSVAAINASPAPKPAFAANAPGGVYYPNGPGYNGKVVTSGLDAPTHYQFEPDKVVASAPPKPAPAQPVAPEFKPYTKGLTPEDPWAADNAKLDAVAAKYAPKDQITAENAGKYSADLDAIEKKYTKPAPKSSSSKPSFASAVANKKKAG